MHLNLTEITARVFDEEINFKIGETIHTENSYKYTYKTFEDLVESAGYEIQNFFSDENFFLVYLF